MSYQEKKQSALTEAMDWQKKFALCDHSYAELAETEAHFEALGRRYGLLSEFRENGIL